MRHLQSKVEGYDCFNVPCQHMPKGDHGICAERWRYSVITDEGDVALTLGVTTTIYPATVSAQTRELGSWRAYMTRHIAFPRSAEEMLTMLPKELRPAEDVGVLNHEECDLLTGGRCFSDGSHDWGQRVWEKRGRREYEQIPEFWTLMEQELREFAERVRQERFDLTHLYCPLCHGKAIIDRTREAEHLTQIIKDELGPVYKLL